MLQGTADVDLARSMYGATWSNMEQQPGGDGIRWQSASPGQRERLRGEIKLLAMEQTIAHDVAVVLLSEPRSQNNMGIWSVDRPIMAARDSGEYQVLAF